MAELLAKVQELQNLDPGEHWFCPGDGATGGKPAQNLTGRHQDLVVDSFKLFAYDSENIAPQKEFLVNGIDAALGRCEQCIIGYYKAKKKYIELLREDYDDEDVETFAGIFYDLELDRIRKGLEQVSNTLEHLPVSQRSLNAVDRNAKNALIESLASDKFLSQSGQVKELLIPPLGLLQMNVPYAGQTVLPGIVDFLFSEDQMLSDWAFQNLSRFPPIGKDDFDFAVRGSLVRVLSKSAPFPENPAFTDVLWRGIDALLKKLHKEAITRSLRSIDIDICKLALEHLQIKSDGVRYILMAIKTLLIVGPQEFWDSMGAIGPTVIVEQAFKSPKYRSLLAKAGHNKDNALFGSLLGWVYPLFKSLRLGQQPPVCRTLSDYLMIEFQKEDVPADAKERCFEIGAGCFAHTLRSCNQNRQPFDTVSRAVATDILAAFASHLDAMFSKIDGQPGSSESQRCVKEASSSISESLALECKIVHTDKINILRGQSSQFAQYNPNIWINSEARLGRGNVVLAKSVIKSLSGAPDLSSGSRTPATPGGSDTFSALCTSICSSLDKVSLFSLADLKPIAEDSGSVQCIIQALCAAEKTIYESSAELVKAITEEASVRDALRRLSEVSLQPVLQGLEAAASRITSSGMFDPSPRLVKMASSIVEILCDSQDGLLRKNAYLQSIDSGLIESFWEELWKSLKMMYQSSENWSLTKVAPSDVLREFVRDVMQFSEYLFDQFNVFGNAVRISRDHQPAIPSSDQETSASKQLLNQPSQTMEGITKYLRLKDDYLLQTSVQLVGKLLKALTKEGLQISAQSRDYLTQIAIFNKHEEPSKRIGTKTLLSETELASLGVDLEANVGQPCVAETREQAIIEAGLTDDLQSAEASDASHRATPERTFRDSVQHKKQTTLNMGTWLSKGKPQTAESIARASPKPEQQKLKDLPAKKPPAKGLLQRSVGLRQANEQKTSAQRDAFILERKKQKQEALARKAEQVARIKKGIPGALAEQTAGQGSALSGLGLSAKDHGVRGENMMVSSDSENDSNSDDEFDEDLFGVSKGSKVSKNVAEYYASKSVQKKPVGPVKKKKVIRSARDMRARLAPSMTALHNKILSWEFFFDEELPPGSDKNQYKAVEGRFRTLNEYRSTFESLLLLEAWSSLQKSREEGGFKVFEVNVANRISVDSMFEVSTTLDANTYKEAGIYEADLILLSKSPKPAGDPTEPHCLGRVSKVKPKKGHHEVTLQISRESQTNSWMTQNSKVYACKLESLTTLEREYGALAGLEYYDLCQEILRAEISPVLSYSNEKLNEISARYSLNRAQAVAVQSAIDNDAFTLIQGPPGSGKTKTIVAMVGALLTKSVRHGDAPPAGNQSAPNQTQASGSKKLLVCAPSNAAVDELVMRFMAGVKFSDGTSFKPNVVRLGRSDRINPQVADVTLDVLVDKIMNPTGVASEREASELEKTMNRHKMVSQAIREFYAEMDEMETKGIAKSHEHRRKEEQLKRERQELSNQIERLKDGKNTAVRDADIKRRQAEQSILTGAHILCATLSGSARETFQHLTIDFETVLIDEAAQCIELSAIIPLKYGCSKCIMVGDPKQLPPTVFSREATRFLYEQSLFVRMQKNQPGDVHLLDTQYRMHPDISIFPSKTFYDGKLLDGPGLAEQRIKPWHQDKYLAPYYFFDVEGRQETSRGHSLINTAEVATAMDLTRRLFATVEWYNFKGKIGIITPYKSQLRLLTDRFTASFGPDITKTIEFNTTDAFQGRESEIIMFSCVRASDGGIGFLSDIRRMNVGITRAKCSLWILGNATSLCRGHYWKSLVEDAKSRKLFAGISVSKSINNPKTIQPVPQTHADKASSIQAKATKASTQDRQRRISGPTASDPQKRNSGPAPGSTIRPGAPKDAQSSKNPREPLPAGENQRRSSGPATGDYQRRNSGPPQGLTVRPGASNALHSSSSPKEPHPNLKHGVALPQRSPVDVKMESPVDFPADNGHTIKRKRSEDSLKSEPEKKPADSKPPRPPPPRRPSNNDQSAFIRPKQKKRMM